MIDNKIIEIVEKVKLQSSENIRKLQSGLIPRLINCEALEKDYYTLDGQWFYREASQRIFLLNDIRFKNLNSRGKNNRIFKEPMLDLIANDGIYPFVLFINNLFIKWSNITIVNDYKYQYVIIDNVLPADSYILHMIDIPFNVGYSESRQYSSNDQIIFKFDEEGKSSVTGRTILYTKKDTNLLYSLVVAPLGEVKDIDIIIEDKYKLYPENFVVFKDGLLYPDANIKITELNLLTIDEGFNSGQLEYIFFYDKRTLTPKDNIYKLKNSEYVKYLVRNTDQVPDYLDELEQDFNLSFDKQKEYEQNIKDALKYIFSYDACLLNEAYDRNCVTIEMTGAAVNALVKDGCLRMLRLKARKLDTFVMIFVNGLLYKRYSELVYDLNSFTIPITDIEDNDKIEFVYFVEVDNTIISPVQINSDTNTIYALQTKGLQIFADKPKDAIFPNINYNSYANYLIDHTIEDSKLIIDEFYYNKDLSIAYENQFRYTSCIANSERFKLKLPPDFRFCTILSKYMVFINGKKVDPSLYNITLVKASNPFTDISVYVQVGLNVGDKLEVVYVPVELNNIYDTKTIIETSIIIEEGISDYSIALPYANFIKDGNSIRVYAENYYLLTDTSYTLTDNILHFNMATISGEKYDIEFVYNTTPGLNDTGYIYLNRDKIPYPLDSDLYFVFINGKKVHKQDIQNLSSNLIRVTTDVGSLKRVEILPHSNKLITLFEYMNSDKSMWDYIIDSIPRDELNSMMSTYNIITELDEGLVGNISKEAIMNEIIRDYFMRPYVNEGSPFVFDYDTDTFRFKDSGGNYIALTMDANRYINVKIEE